MPLAEYICPDKEHITIYNCLTRCRLGRRCLTRTTLGLIAKDRPWDGTPHVTQLLNGTIMEYLRITQPYAIDPHSRAYALLGTEHHNLQQSVDTFSELGLHIGWVQGTLDLLEVEDSEVTLSDFKTYGSYRVAKCLGLVRAGKTFAQDPAQVDLHDEALQLNMYRVMVEKQMYLKVDRMQLQVTVRDGGIKVANERGVTQPMYLIEVPFLPDGQVLATFQAKAEALQQALKTNQPTLCTSGENWGGRRCVEYCEVAKHCPLGGR